jgi:lipopolysaccharide/colanic/teichoic acid biosynthesis glycosyltransferase
LAAATPVLATCAVIIRRGSRGPIFFRQKRIGQNGRAFTMLKLRTMYVDADSTVHEAYVKRYIAGEVGVDAGAGARIFKLVGDARITPAGRWLRRLSLDELPQLLNVLRGDMSLVGPRPPLPYEVEQYGSRALQRLRARPGITGLWQVSGRNHTTFDEMIDLDVQYIERWSVWLDLSILARTIPVVLFPDGH